MDPLYRLHVSGKGFIGGGLNIGDDGTIVEKLSAWPNYRDYRDPSSLIVRGAQHTGIAVEGKTHGIYVQGGQYGLVAVGQFGISGASIEKDDRFPGVMGTGTTGVKGMGTTRGIWGVGPQMGVHGEGQGVGWGGYFYSPQGSGLYAATGKSDKNYAAVFNGNIIVQGLVNPSDRRFKKDIESVDNALDLVKMLQPKRYEFKQETNGQGSLNFPEGKHYGFIAQEVEQLLPSLVKDNDISSYGKQQVKFSEKDSFKSINYIEFIPLLTRAIQEQQITIEKQQKQIDELIKQFQEIQKGFK